MDELKITATLGAVSIEIRRVGADVFVTAPHYARQQDVEHLLEEMAALLGGSGPKATVPSARGKRMIRLEKEGGK